MNAFEEIEKIEKDLEEGKIDQQEADILIQEINQELENLLNED